MTGSKAARRYARALFELAREEGTLDEVREELRALDRVLDEVPELRAVLFRPLRPVAERRRVLLEVADRLPLRPLVRNFAAFLIDRRRVILFAAIRAEFERLVDAAEGRVRAEVVTASPLSTPAAERLREALAARTGRQVELDIRVEPDLIGGVVAVVGALRFDGSLRTQLRRLHANLTKG